MAENENGTEKSEEPTGRRLEKAAEEGQVPRSKELANMVLLLGAAGAILIFGSMIVRSLENVWRYSFQIDREELMNIDAMGHHLIQATSEVFWGLLPFMIIMIIATIVGNTLLGGWNFSTRALAPKISNLDPIKGIKRMFGVKSLVELIKSIAKAAVVGAAAYLVILIDIPELLEMGREDVRVSIKHAVEVLAWTFLWISLSLIVIALIDVPFQMYQHKKDLRMTKQEVKDEFRDTEGKPEIKNKVRQLQFQMAQRRMLQEVPKADVVITNPTHYSVALRYHPDKDAAPILVAKGADHMAMKIREIARHHKIEIMASPPLARAIYAHTEIGREIPSGLYLAVAQVLAYVFQLRRWRSGYGNRPGRPDIPPVPPEYQVRG